MQKQNNPFIYAWSGIRLLFQRERNSKIHLLFTLGVIGLGIVLRLQVYDWSFLIVAISLVWITEGFNTALEILSDRITEEYDGSIKQVKDLAAGVVLIATIGAIIIGLIILLPPAIKYF